SAASPQVAGAAALLLQHTPGLTPAGIASSLEAAASKAQDDAGFPGKPGDTENGGGHSRESPVNPVDNEAGSGSLSMPPLTTRERIAAAFVGFGSRNVSGVVTMNAD